MSNYNNYNNLAIYVQYSNNAINHIFQKYINRNLNIK